MFTPVRGSRRLPLLVFGAAILLVLGTVVGLQLLSSNGDTGPTTPAAKHEVALPGINTGWQGKAVKVTLFDRFTISRPSGEIWDRGGESASEKKGEVNFTDISGCSSLPDCTVITFADLADPTIQARFGDNPPSVWARESCTLGPAGELAGSKEFDLDGQTVRYYYLPCGNEEEYSGHAWYIPGKELFIFTYAGNGGPLSPEILWSVVETIRWI